MRTMTQRRMSQAHNTHTGGTTLHDERDGGGGGVSKEKKK
jgi:hypothetical protein